MIKVRFKSRQVTEARRQELIREAESLGAIFESYDPAQNELLFKLSPGINRKEFMDTLAKNN
ncbi:MAG: hypothetical protein GX039_07580 [Clostridia bacterium]|nr:hypothetical protein [Clostridia bacterium]